MRNSYKYTMMYSGLEPEFREGDIFKIIIPLSVGSMTKVGPEALFTASELVRKSSEQVEEALAVKLNSAMIQKLLAYCTEARRASEMQQICQMRSREYFRKSVLVPLLKSGRLQRTIPDKPNSSKQKYIRA